MNNYSNLRIPRDIKAQVKLSIFYLIDIMIIGGLFVLCQSFQQSAQFTLGNYIFLQVVTLSFGLFLCAKPASCPEKRNFQVILQLFMSDKRKYVSEDYSIE